MIVVGILASLVFLVVIARFALSKKANKPVRRAALAALVAIGLAVAVCLIVIAAAPQAVEEGPIFAGLSPVEPAPAIDFRKVFALLFGAALLVFVGAVIFRSLRNEKKSEKSVKKGPRRPG
jgi:cytochrome bd-type quinol oxidase subunit 2